MMHLLFQRISPEMRLLFRRISIEIVEIDAVGIEVGVRQMEPPLKSIHHRLGLEELMRKVLGEESE